jgi:hypothetical protein
MIMNPNRNNSSIQDHNQASQAQIFIILAVAFLVLVAFVGLAVDAGLAFIAYGKMARAADAAALAAAAQFREGRLLSEMQATAKNAMAINGVDLSKMNVEICDYSLPEEDQDPQLCPSSGRKKLVRITVWADIPTAFIRVVGIDKVNLSTISIAEAASLDVVLVIDISESMAWDAEVGDPLRDPYYCNNQDITGSDGFPGECKPFEDVKVAASEFIGRVLDKPADEEEDRLAIVTFGNGWSTKEDPPGSGIFVPDLDMATGIRTSGWTSDQSFAQTIVENLKVVQPEPCFWADGSERTLYGPCAWYDPPTEPPDLIDSASLVQIYCNSCANSGDLSGLTTTNIGGGLLHAGNMFGIETREEALWVVVLLTDGNANATTPEEDDDITNFSTYPMGFCPNDWVEPLCQDEDISTRHGNGDTNYDADDYARDMADFVGCPSENGRGSCAGVEGQAAIIFTIGLGEGVRGVMDTSNEVNGLPYGTALLRYIAAVGDDSDPTTDPCDAFWEDQADWQEWCGHYYFSPSGGQLSAVFQDIASRVFTRLTR